MIIINESVELVLVQASIKEKKDTSADVSYRCMEPELPDP